MRASIVPGVVVGTRYELLAQIGRGASAAVWRARDLVDGSLVALKCFPRGSERAAERRWELTVLRRLQGPGVVGLRDEGRDRGRPFVVMELVAGTPFGDGGPHPWTALAKPTRALLGTLARMHGEGFVHCDLKPANVLLRDGEPVMLDFGAARPSGQLRVAPEIHQGTVDYLAPERWEGEASPQSDLYAVAVMVHQALTGRLPFPVSGSIEQRMRRRAMEPPRTHWRAFLGACPPAVVDAFERALAPERRDRPPSAEALLARLDERAASVTPRAPAPAEHATETELRALFEGPERLLHLPEDAARLLFARTGGERVAVARELRAWERTGFAHPRGGRLVVSREALDRAQLDDLPCDLLPAPLPDSARFAALPYAAHELARWLSLRCAPCSAALLARAAGVSAEHAAPTLRALVDAGVAREASADEFVLVFAPPDPWSPQRRRDAHARFVDASEPGDPGRLHHALEGAVAIATLRAQLHATTTRLVQAGRIGSAREVLTVAVRALLGREGVCADDLADAFTLWLRAVLEQWTLAAVDELALAVSTAHARLGGLAVFERLADAARCRLQPAEATISILRAVPATGDATLELIRREIRFYALRSEPEQQRRELAEAEAAAPDHPDFARFFASCRARLAYATGNFSIAMGEYLRTAEGETWAGRALRARLNAAAAALDAGHLPEAALWSAAVRERAEALRLPAIEAQALYLQRATAWRQGDDAPPEPAWIEAARQVDPMVMRYLAFNDAARAWRAHDLAAFCAARDAAAAAEGQAGESLSRSMLDGMAVDLGLATLLPEERERVLVTTEQRVPRIALQVAALTHRATRGRRDDPRWRRYAADVPQALWATRLDVMSVNDCLARLDVDPSTG